MCIPHRSKRPIVSRPGVPPYCRKIGRFCFKCPTDSLKITHVYPMSTRRNAWGARAYWFFTLLRRPPGGLPFSNVKKPRNACCAGALRLFSCPGCWGYGIAEMAQFSVFSACCTKRKGASLPRGPRRNRRKRRCDSEKMEPASGNFRKESNTI